MYSSTSAIRFSGLASGLDTESIVNQLMQVEKMKVTRVEQSKQKLEWRKEIWQDLNKKIYDFWKDEIASMRSGSTFLKNKASLSDEGVAKVTPTTSAIKGTHELEIQQLARSAFLTSGKLTNGTTADSKITNPGTFTITTSVGTADIAITSDDTVSSVMKKISSAVNASDESLGVTATYDESLNKIFISTKETGGNQKIELSGDTNLLNELGLSGSETDYMYQSGQNAKVIYNGATLEPESNNVSINGLKMSFTDIGTTYINISSDPDAVYDKVKGFVNKYNEILTEITEKVQADPARGYEPLTDEQKQSMSDNDVELWEKKIKDSLLRRDDVLESLRSSMRSVTGALYGKDSSGNPLDPGFKALSSLGIETGDWKEQGVLHIMGDDDDELYSGKTNKLKKAIEENPDAVMDLLNTMGNKLYENFQDKMKHTDLSSALTFYHDKLMDNQIDDYEDRISELQEQADRQEEAYYRKFTALEQAMQQMNNQSNSLMQMLGGGSNN